VFNGVPMDLAVLFSVCEPAKLGSPIANQTIVFDAKQTYMISRLALCSLS
jgi:hypothetical protein